MNADRPPALGAADAHLPHAEENWLARPLRKLTSWICGNPGTTLVLITIFTLISLGVTVRFLRFKTDRADLIHPAAEFHQRWLRYTESFGDQTEALVVIEGISPDAIRHAMDDLGQLLSAEKTLFSRVQYRIDLQQLESKSLQYLSPRDLASVLEQLTEYGPILNGNWELAGIEAHARMLSNRLGQLRFVKQAAAADPSGEPDMLIPPEAEQQLGEAALLFARSLNSFQAQQSEFVPPWPAVLSRGAQTGLQEFKPIYQLNEQETMGFITLTLMGEGQDFGGASKSLAKLRQLVREFDDVHTEVEIGLTGIPVLESDEMQRSQQDMTWASIFSFCGVGAIMLLGFRGFRHPLLSMLTLCVGVIWSLGYTTIAIGHLNILSVSFAAILMGLGIDFAIHFLAKYLELRHQGQPLERSLENTSASVGTGIITAAVTTSLAFFCATFTTFLGVSELGIITGGGVLVCAAATFLVLPALVVLSDRKIEPRKLPTPFEGNLIRYLTRHYPGAVCLLTLAAILAIGSQGFRYRDGQFSSRVIYDSNLLHLQARGLASVELQHRMFENSNSSLLFAVSIADSPAQAKQLKSRLLDLPTVSRVDELASALPSYPPAETQLLVQAIRARLDRLSELPAQFPQLDPESIGQSLEGLYKELEQWPDRWGVQAAQQLDQFLDRLTALELPQQMQQLQQYQRNMLQSLHQQFELLRRISDPQPVGPEDLPEVVRSRFISPQGEWLLRIFPREQIWDEEPLARFVADVRSVDPEVTGTPLQNYEAARQIQQSYLNAAIYSLAAIILVLLIDGMQGAPLVLTLASPLLVLIFAVFTVQGSTQVHPVWWISGYTSLAVVVAAIFDFRSVRNTLLALSPPLLGLFLLFGILGLLGVHLNPANMIVLPLVLGIGVDDGVHVIHDFRSQRGRYRTAASTINAITLTSLTSMMGFGSMLLAAHQGLVSLAIVLVVGVGACLFVSLVTLPAILTLIGTDKDCPAVGTILPGELDSPGTAFEAELTEEDAAPHVLPITLARDEHGAA
jgi:hopanoid biosynthesis associated RND transporter like protein HpnN